MHDILRLSRKQIAVVLVIAAINVVGVAGTVSPLGLAIAVPLLVAGAYGLVVAIRAILRAVTVGGSHAGQ